MLTDSSPFSFQHQNPGWTERKRRKANPEMTAEAGMVINHATTMFLATPQRTAEILWPAPTPMMLEETTWVVETGPPKSEAANITVAEEV